VSAVLLQRIVRMGGPVDDDMANLIVAQLLYLDSADQQKDITMYVNSPGGSVTAGGLDWLVAGWVGWLVFGWLAGRHTNCV
jgi:ATP-dependent Clp endopeptidase proteolytic subunit ClpP